MPVVVVPGCLVPIPRVRMRSDVNFHGGVIRDTESNAHDSVAAASGASQGYAYRASGVKIQVENETLPWVKFPIQEKPGQVGLDPSAVLDMLLSCENLREAQLRYP